MECIESILGQPCGDRLLVDKNPAMTPMIPVVKRLFPHAMILFAVRDPRDVILSCYLRYLPLNPVSVHFLTLESTAEKYVADMACWKKYRDPLGEDAVWLRYEDVVDDFEAQANRVLERCGLAWEKAMSNYRQNTGGQMVLSPTYEDVTKPIYRRAMGRWQNYESHMGEALERLAPLVEEFGYA